MYVDRAEYLVRLADALDVETMSSWRWPPAAWAPSRRRSRSAARCGRCRIDGKKPVKPAAKLEAAELSADATQFAINPVRFETATRGVVLLVSSAGEGRAELDVGAVAPRRRRRPRRAELLDGHVPRRAPPPRAGVPRPRPRERARVRRLPRARGPDEPRQRRCRVVAGTATLTDAVEKPALMAGAASVTLFPFGATVIQWELDRLEERLGPRKPDQRSPPARLEIRQERHQEGEGDALGERRRGLTEAESRGPRLGAARRRRARGAAGRRRRRRAARGSCSRRPRRCGRARTRSRRRS